MALSIMANPERTKNGLLKVKWDKEKKVFTLSE
jgi:hypothetical protein